MIIKVCGMRESYNVKALYDVGIRTIGFIFYEKSKRFFHQSIDVLDIENLPSDVNRVGVFVNEKLDKVIDIISDYNLTHVQLHGEESAEYCRKVNKYAKVIKAFRVDEHFDFEETEGYAGCDYLLFDAKGSEYGGNGIQYNWTLLNKYNKDVPFILSGGIGPNDAEKVNKINHPQFAGIDINSGFEIKPGLKNVNQIKSFINHLSCSTQ